MRGAPHFQKRLKIGLGFLLVSGLDALVILAVWIYRWLRFPDLPALIFPSIDWWNKAGQVNSWPHHVLWVPHHTACVNRRTVRFYIVTENVGSNSEGGKQSADCASISGACIRIRHVGLDWTGERFNPDRLGKSSPFIVVGKEKPCRC